jgi:hypothetical protein
VKSPSYSKKPLPYGTITIRYNSLALLRQIKEEISDLVEGRSQTQLQKPV